ncbi:unnamed protein product [Echinostoma caproni]|uniref:SHSP domain-containing protein n=1 Tax=Echinostoma caproni TaxID=27848 RepID=A0A183AJJ6_9TREM|nr:unnamed protein product [Echinostoma caproni]
MSNSLCELIALQLAEIGDQMNKELHLYRGQLSSPNCPEMGYNEHALEAEDGTAPVHSDIRKYTVDVNIEFRSSGEKLILFTKSRDGYVIPREHDGVLQP